jgi:hypothetical protein
MLLYKKNGKVPHVYEANALEISGWRCRPECNEAVHPLWEGGPLHCFGLATGKVAERHSSALAGLSLFAPFAFDPSS